MLLIALCLEKRVLILNGEAIMEFRISIQAYQENAGQFS